MKKIFNMELMNIWEKKIIKRMKGKNIMKENNSMSKDKPKTNKISKLSMSKELRKNNNMRSSMKINRPKSRPNSIKRHINRMVSTLIIDKYKTRYRVIIRKVIIYMKKSLIKTKMQ